MPTNALHLETGGEERTLIEQLISEQRSLTAVDRFSQKHARHEVPIQSKYYRDLIPLATPKPGEQYAFEVNLDQCSGCKACVTACHGLNGLDDNETWRDIGLLHGGTHSYPVQQHVTTACHHCVDPACLNGCPVLAYDKDPVTGIVRHLDDQCIGCQYCVLKCPYDVPKYSAQRGIVRKCDMCSNRLAVGEAPACVQACPTEAIRITVINQAETVAKYRNDQDGANSFLPASPSPAYTVPTTRYRSGRQLPGNLRAGDTYQSKRQPAHLPLVFMLVLTQLSVGAFTLEWILDGRLARVALVDWVALTAGLTGIAVSVAHLGRPLGAWRAFLGLRKSWLSREIVVFGAFMGLALAHSAETNSWLPFLRPFHTALLAGTVLSGLTGVFCSTMIYHDTTRVFWSRARSGAKFFGSTLILGLASGLLGVASQGDPVPGWVLALAVALLAATTAKLGNELALFRHLAAWELTSLKRTALLLSGPLNAIMAARVVLGVSGGILIPLVLLLASAQAHVAASSGLVPGFSVAAFGLLLVGELLERYLYFTAVAPDKMPGGVAS